VTTEIIIEAKRTNQRHGLAVTHWSVSINV